MKKKATKQKKRKTVRTKPASFCSEHHKCVTNTTLMWGCGLMLTVGLAICSFFANRFATVDSVNAIDKRLARIEDKIDRFIESRLVIVRPDPKKDANAW